MINVPVAKKPQISEVPALVEAIKRAEKTLGDKGRVLVRYSGTEPVCRVMVEGERKDIIETCAREIAGVVTKTLNE